MGGGGSSPPQTTNSQPDGRVDGVLTDDEVLHVRESLRTRDMMLMPVSWVKPPSQNEASHPQQQQPRLRLVTKPTPHSDQPPNLYLLTPPPPAGDTSTSGDQQCGKEAPKSTNAKDSSTSKKATASVAGGAKHDSTGEDRDSTGSGSTTDTSEDHGIPIWSFTVDMNGCNDVTVMPVGNKLVIEGVEVTRSYTKMVGYVTWLPSHVSPDFLGSTFVNGRLTVTQESLVELKGEGVTQSTQQQQAKQKAPKVRKQQQQQQQVSEVEKQQ